MGIVEKVIIAIFVSLMIITSPQSVHDSGEVTEETIQNRWGITLTEDELYELARVVWLESGGETDACQQAVIEVVFNRVEHWGFEDTVLGVLSESGQFVVWSYRDEARPDERVYANIQAVLNGETSWTVPETVYFATRPLTDDEQLFIEGVYFCNQR